MSVLILVSVLKISVFEASGSAVVILVVRFFLTLKNRVRETNHLCY